eukprot:COSAG02_NODE_4157_length_5696_cov_6.012328_1_plen_46_part_10
MPGGIRTDTFGQEDPRHEVAPDAEEWTNQGRGGGITAADTMARTFT